MKINYTIEIFSDWHIGSGLDSGADADAVVLKDENNLPYIPGKTIKGLLRDSLQEMQNVKKIPKDIIDEIFGGEKKEKDENGKEKITTFSGNSFFANAELAKAEKNEIITNNLSTHLYKNIASTRININGIAKQNSLRTIEVCIPVTLKGEIETNVENADEIIEKAFKWTRYIGVNRNRGLGRCKFIKID